MTKMTLLTPSVVTSHRPHFNIGGMAEAKQKRKLALELNVDAPEPFESWDGLIATNKETLQSMLGWLDNQIRIFGLDNRLGSFELMGIRFVSEPKDKQLMLVMPTAQLLRIRGMRWEGNPMFWPDWEMPTTTFKEQLSCFLKLPSNEALLALPISRRPPPKNVVS
jgi:hypothetical protein